MRIITGTANPNFAKAISEYIDSPLTGANPHRFADNEQFLKIQQNVRGDAVFVIQSTCSSQVNGRSGDENFMELLRIIHTARLASAGQIIAVIPYFGYARQDRKTDSRTPISAKLNASLIEAAGVDGVITMDLHAGQIQGFFDRPVDNLYAAPIIVRDMWNYLDRRNTDNLCIVSPDVGGVVRARELANRANIDSLAIIDKRREKANHSEVMNIIGDVKGKHCIMVDDMIDTAGTITNGAKALVEIGGAVSVRVYATHGVFSGPAYDRINDCADLTEVIVTDTIPLVNHPDKIRTISVAPLFAEAIISVSTKNSISRLFRT